MSNSRNTHTDEQLRIGSKYFIYHVKMYVETLLWLQSQERPDGWDTIRNAIIETHLVHERVLINFICNSTARDTDLLAIDYFHDVPSIFYPPQDDFLNGQASRIGGQLVHLTTKPMPNLKSEQDWQIRETAKKLVPALQIFLYKVSEPRFPDNVKIACLQHLARLSPPEIPVSLTVST